MVYIDTNIALEVLLEERASQEAVIAYLSRQDKVYMSMLTVHHVWHFGRKVGIAESVLADFVGAAGLIPLLPEDYVWARKHEAGRDFEDALQVAVALRAGVSVFVTLDQALVRAYDGKVGFAFLNPAALNS